MTGFDALAQLLNGVLLATEHPSFTGVTASLLGCVLLISGLSKMRHPQQSAEAMVNFDIIDRAITPLGLALSLGEVVLGVSLLMPNTWRLSLPISFLLFTSFAIILTKSLLQGKRFACNCFGPTGDPISVTTFVRAAALAGIALWTTIGVEQANSGAGTRFVSVSEFVTGAGCVAIIALTTVARTLLNASAATNAALGDRA